MKDIVLQRNVRKRTAYFWSVFAIGFLMNLSIIIYKTPWYEIFSQLGYVL